VGESLVGSAQVDQIPNLPPNAGCVEIVCLFDTGWRSATMLKCLEFRVSPVQMGILLVRQ